MNQTTETLHAPPRFLLWLVIVIFFLLIVGALAGFSYFSGGQRLGSLIPYLIVAAAGVIIAAVGGAFLFRRSLPRLLWLWVTLLALVLLVIMVGGGIFAYRNILPPRYQEQMLTEMPFMRSFLPPTPQGGLLPTLPPREGGISADDLLSLSPLDTTQPAAASTEAPTAEPTQPIVVAPTETPISTPTALPPTPTDVPPTAAAAVPTTVAAAPTQVQNTSAVNRPGSNRMYGFTYVRQGWNDCGPANITMALSHYGWRQNMDYAANAMKPNPEDKNVSPYEMVNFVRNHTQVSAITRIGGDMNLLKDFISANIPVIAETGYSLEGEDWLGHYQTIVGYDDAQGVFYIYDSWLGTGVGDVGLAEPYSKFDQNWQMFNRTFIVIYEKEREGTVQRILGERADVARADQIALDTALAEARANRQNAFAWFNAGTSYDKLGMYEEAAAAFDRAIQLKSLPFRMLWYQFGPFDAYFNVGRYDDVLALVSGNLTSAGSNVEETFYWQGKVYAAQGRRSEAQASFQRAIAQNPNYEAAREALNSL